MITVTMKDGSKRVYKTGGAYVEDGGYLKIGSKSPVVDNSVARLRASDVLFVEFETAAVQPPPAPEPVTGQIAMLQSRHHAWAKRTFRKRTPLESLALVAGEVGEAANECRGDKPTGRLGEELADIVLRVMDLAGDQKISLEAELLRKMEINKRNGSRGRKA